MGGCIGTPINDDNHPPSIFIPSDDPRHKDYEENERKRVMELIGAREELHDVIYSMCEYHVLSPVQVLDLKLRFPLDAETILRSDNYILRQELRVFTPALNSALRLQEQREAVNLARRTITQTWFCVQPPVLPRVLPPCVSSRR